MEKFDNVKPEDFRELEKEIENLMINYSNSRRQMKVEEEKEDPVKLEIIRANSRNNSLIEELLFIAYRRMFLKYWKEADRAYVLIEIAYSLYELIDIGVKANGENKGIFLNKLNKEIDKWMEQFIHNGGLGMTMENNEK